MRIHIVAIGARLPAWVEDGCREYAKRIKGQIRVVLHEVSPAHRTKGADLKRLLRDEGARLLKSVPARCRIIALDRSGRRFDTRQLCEELTARLNRSEDLAMLIGGPEGLDPQCLKSAQAVWSLSPLTLAHPLARLVLVEQLYRVWSIINNLPYHR